MTHTDLTQKAMLVSLSISQWTAKKHDKKVSQEVADNYGASHNSGRYNKVLVAQEAIKAISKVANKARSYHYENTLPWNDEGARILPSAHFDEYSAKMRDFRGLFESEVQRFIESYPQLKEQARIQLNGLFREEDYPPENKIARKYGFEVRIDPLPSAQDFRVQLNEQDAERIRRDIQDRTQAAQAEAMRDLWNRVYDAVSHMADKLSQSDAVFRDSLVNNLCSLTRILPKLNITGDQVLEKMRADIEEKLCSNPPERLRNNKAARRETAQSAQGILDAMAGYMGK